jgi:hypothetical protein
MWPFRRNPGPAPKDRAVWLSAYVDGELTGEECVRAEAWLARDAAARAAADELRRLKALSDAARAPEPDPAAWGAVLARVESALEARPPAAPVATRPAGRRRRRARWAAGVAAAAAAVLLAVLLSRERAPDAPPELPEAEVEPFAVVGADEVTIDDMDPADGPALVVGAVPVQVPLGEGREPFPVVSAGEVTVESIDAADVAALVIGEPPLHWPLVLAGQGDVWIDYVGGEWGGTPPYLHESVAGEPMMVPGVAWGPKAEKGN